MEATILAGGLGGPLRFSEPFTALFVAFRPSSSDKVIKMDADFTITHLWLPLNSSVAIQSPEK